MYKIFFLSLLFVPFYAFAESVDVSADIPSGIYYAPIYITLTPTTPNSKTFYSFKPDGYPGDAFLYTGAVLLKHSSPFVYFSIISPTNESKIKQNNYTIEYSSAIHFETESISGSGKVDVALVNSGTERVNIGFWRIQSESDTMIIPEGTMVDPGTRYSTYLNYPGTSSIVLRSPDDDERDILVPQEFIKENETIPFRKKITTKIVPRRFISTRETSPSLIQKKPDAPVAIENILGTVANENEGRTPNIPSSVDIKSSSPPPVPLDIGRIVKVSTAESGQTNVNPLYLALILALSVGIGGFRWLMKKQK